MIGPLTNNRIFYQEENIIPASGRWHVPLAFDRRPHWSLPASLRKAGLGLVLAISTVTSGADPWLVDRRRMAQLTRNAFDQAIRGRRVNLQEARRIAIQAVIQAEELRRRYAEEESKLGIDWGHDV